MLNLDLLRTTFRNGKFFCRFADPGNEENLSLAGNLLTLFKEGCGRCRSDLAALSKQITAQASDPKFAAGLEKLIFDAAEFSAPDPETDYTALRRELFAASGKAIAAGGDFSEEHYKKQFSFPHGDIYGDLPDFEILKSFREMTAAELICRYNVALVQTMLLYASKVELLLTEPDRNELRKVVKFMKFFRLLALIGEKGKNTLHLELSGPGALFENARKYGLLLGSFFPVVPLLKKYELRAELEIRSRKGVLELSEKSQLVSHFRNISAYVPEEIRLFHRLFKEKVSAWEIVGETPFINMGKEGICFPDLSFRSSSGTLCHLELFHRWHKGEFPRRMAFLEKNPDVSLILGADRGAVNDETFAELAKTFPAAAEKVFRFRDFPGIDSVVKALNKFAQDKGNVKNERKKRKTPPVGS